MSYEHPEGLLRHTAHIAGIKFHPGAAEKLATAAEGDEIIAEMEPENKYDKFAVKLAFDGLPVGHIPATLSREVTDLIKSGRFVKVVKRTGNRLSIYYRKESV